MIKIFCDRCGKEITKHKSHGYIALNARDVKEASLVEDNEFENNQYCSSCMRQIRAFIKAVPENAIVEQNDSESDKNDMKSNKNKEKSDESAVERIDTGKILALKKAGWKNKDIAEEMHISSQTVANIVYHHKTKSGEVGAVMTPILKQERPKL